MSAEGRPSRLPNPWWIPPFLGRVPEGVEPRHLRLLGFVALALFFENYDMSLLGSVLKYLAADFALDEAALGRFTGTIRLGTFPAFLLVPLVDRLGRQRMFMASVAGLSIGAFLTAFSRNPAEFIAYQILSRSFIVTASATAFVIVTEEFPPEHRGWGVGMLGAVASIGFGAGAIVFAGIEAIPFGWRALYALGLIPVFLLGFLRRGVPETRRFELHVGRASDRWSLRRSLEPIRDLIASHPRYAAAVTCLGLLATAGHATAFQLTGYFLLEVHGWRPWQYSTMFFFCGGVGIIGSPLVGRLGDLYGRRALGAVVLVFFPFAAFAFYGGPGWLVPFGWVTMVFASMSSNVLIRALANEVFPTRQRGTAGGWLSSVETLGASAGLFLYAWLQGLWQVQGVVVSAISLLTVVAAAALTVFPETRQRELESITGERPVESGPGREPDEPRTHPST